MSNNKNDLNLYCSFCGRTQKEVKRLISNPDGNSFICDECVDACKFMLQDSIIQSNLEKIELPTPQELKELLDQYVIGQDDAKRVLSVAVYNHYKRINYNLDAAKSNKDLAFIDLDKSNVLMIGPTGTGKTMIAKTLAKLLKVPFAQADATTLTEAGYVGDDVENILLKLIQNANYDIKKAERGIIYIDEIDKISRSTENRSITRDVSGEGVQQALLKILESTVANVPPTGGRKHPHQEMLQIDTSNILFICGGAFVGLDKIIEKRISNSSLGFNAEIKSDKERDLKELLNQIQPQDLIKFGLIPEFVGRLPIVVGLSDLREESLSRILVEPRNAIVKQYKEIFKLDGVELEFTEDAVRAVSKKSIELNTGARGLRTILENCMLNLMYVTPSDKTIKKIIISEDTILKGKEPKIIREKVQPKKELSKENQPEKIEVVNNESQETLQPKIVS